MLNFYQFTNFRKILKAFMRYVDRTIDARGYSSVTGGHSSDTGGYSSDAQGYANVTGGHSSDTQGCANVTGGHANDAEGHANDARGCANVTQSYFIGTGGNFKKTGSSTLNKIILYYYF